MADYRISRFVKTIFRVVPLTNSDQIVANASRQRVGIEFFYVPVDDILSLSETAMYLAIDAVASSVAGIELSGLDDTVKWFFADDGDTPQREFHAVDPSGTQSNLIIIERLLPEHVLQSYLESL